MLQTFPANVNIKPCIQGEDYSEILEFVDEDGALIDLTGLTFTAKARRGASTAVVVTFTCTSPSSGQVKLATTNAITSALAYNTYRYDLFATDGAGLQSCMCYGNWPVVPGITEI